MRGEPSLSRPSIDLNGRWRFWPDVEGKFTTNTARRDFISPSRLDSGLGRARSIDVPGPWQAQHEDLRLWWGTAWYERTFEISPTWRDRRVRICFEAVDYYCNVWINGVLAGSHEGGYLPFDFDVTHLIRWDGDNSVMVEVRDPGRETCTGSAAPFVFDEIPHGKQSWYGPLGGIWLGVRIEATPATFIRSARLWPDVSGDLQVDVAFDSLLGGPPGPASLVQNDGVLFCDILDPSGHIVARTHVDVAAATSSAEARISVSDPQLWDLESPALYVARLRLEVAGLSDGWADHFGYRSVAVEDGRIVLNGRPTLVRGALDQDYYPGTICTPPGEDFLGEQVRAAKQMGLNLLRCHIKIPDPRYLTAADRLGILIWAELPNWNELTEGAAARARLTFEGMLERDFNHPSIIIWTLVNESWGVDLGDPSQRAWVAELYESAKQLDPTRLLVDNSACVGNFHLRSDLNDFHFYRALPDRAREWDDWTADWLEDPSISYSPYGDAVRSGTEPMVLSEFGNWGLPDIEHLVEEPWWFNTGSEWDGGAVVPHGALKRFASWALEEVFGSWSGLAAASQEAQYESLRHEIHDLRSHSAIAGYVITEFTDVHWECNGLLDLERNEKIGRDRLAGLNSADVLALKPRRRRFWSGEVATIESVFSHAAPGDLDDCILECSVPGFDAFAISMGSVPAFTNSPVTAAEITLPELVDPQLIEVSFRLVSRGRSVAASTLELAVWPRRAASPPPEVRVVTRLDAVTQKWLCAGGRAVVVATEPGEVGDTGLEVRGREGTVWEGDWAQGLHWMRPRLTKGTPLRPILTSIWIDLVAHNVIVGLGPERASDVLSGYFVGWLHHTVATTAMLRIGRGLAIVTTFPILGNSEDPLAAWYRNRLMELANEAYA